MFILIIFLGYSIDLVVTNKYEFRVKEQLLCLFISISHCEPEGYFFLHNTTVNRMDFTQMSIFKI